MANINQRKAQQATVAAERRQRVAELYRLGLPQSAIGRKLGISQVAVCKHLETIREEWKKRANQDFSAKLAEELLRLDGVEREAWESFKSSQRPLTKKANKRAGDPKFLSVVQRCIELRLRAMGALKGDTNVNLTQNNVAINWDALMGLKKPTTPDAIEQRILALEGKPLPQFIDAKPIAFQLPEEPLGRGGCAGPTG